MKKLVPVLVLALTGCIYETYEGAAVKAPSGPPVSRDEAERLVAAGISEPVVVDLIEKRGARHLSSDDVVALKKAGMSDEAIQKMIASERKEPDVVVAEGPAYYYHSYYYSPYYSWWWFPSFGFGYTHWGRRSATGVRVGW